MTTPHNTAQWESGYRDGLKRAGLIIERLRAAENRRFAPLPGVDSALGRALDQIEAVEFASCEGSRGAE